MNIGNFYDILSFWFFFSSRRRHTRLTCTLAPYTVNWQMRADSTAPVIALTLPTVNHAYATTESILNIAGTASDNVGVTQVTWSDDHGGGGTARCTANWSVANILLEPGQNNLTVFAREAAGNTASWPLIVTSARPDQPKPAIAITTPTSAAAFSTTSGLLHLA